MSTLERVIALADTARAASGNQILSIYDEAQRLIESLAEPERSIAALYMEPIERALLVGPKSSSAPLPPRSR